MDSDYPLWSGWSSSDAGGGQSDVRCRAERRLPVAKAPIPPGIHQRRVSLYKFPYASFIAMGLAGYSLHYHMTPGLIKCDRSLRWLAVSCWTANAIDQELEVPRISEFYGIAICLYYDDHQPPHFHAIYGEYEAVISIESAATMQGRLPPRAAGLVREGATLHKTELEGNWRRARLQLPLEAIAPLD